MKTLDRRSKPHVLLRDSRFLGAMGWVMAMSAISFILMIEIPRYVQGAPSCTTDYHNGNITCV